MSQAIGRAKGSILLALGFAAWVVAAEATAQDGTAAQTKSNPAASGHLGWSNTQYAGQAAGEIGGTVSSSTTPVFYAEEIAPRGMGDGMKASGAICLPEQSASKSAVFIGWFNSNFRGWRFPTCLGFWVSGDEDPNDVFFTYALNGSWNGARGAKATNVRVPRDSARHIWSIEFNPQANAGNGAIIFVLDGGEPFVAELPPGYWTKDATVDRFGMLQTQASSDPFTLYLDDLQTDGKTQEFSADPGWHQGAGETRPEPDYTERGRHANSAWRSQPITQDKLEERIKAEPDGALSFYTRNKDNKLVKSFMITPEGSLVAGGTITNGPEVPLTSEPPALHTSEYDNTTNGARLSWVNDFFFSLNKSAGLGRMQSEGQPMLLLRVLALMGRGDSPDIQLGRAGPDNGRTNYGPMEATEAGSCLGKVIFKAYIKDDEKVEGEWTGDVAGMFARNETVATKEKSPASLHFATAGDSVKGGAWRENIERMVIRSNGFVAIGDEFNQPTERLHVQGNIKAEGDMVAGGAKKFVIEHPTRPGGKLSHAAIEGPESAVYYRGEAQLVGGRAEIELPEYFEALTAEEGRTVLLTNVDGFDRLAVMRQEGVQVKAGRFVVMSDNQSSAQAFSWEVKAIRSDLAPLEVER